MPPTLDIAFYPHIIDHILSVAPYEALVRLRVASRTFRAKADALLNADRIIIADLARGYRRIVVMTPYGSNPPHRIPAFARWDKEYWGRDHNGDSDVDYDLSLTRGVDLVRIMTLGGGGRVEKLLASRPFETVRFMHTLDGCDRNAPMPDGESGHWYSICARTSSFVLFTPLPHLFYEGRSAVALVERPDASYDKSSSSDDSASSAGVRRAVINLSVHPDDGYCLGLADELTILDFSSLHEAVWVFHPANESAYHEDLYRNHPSPLFFSMAEMLDLVATSILSHLNGGADTTVVGVESLGQCWREEVASDAENGEEDGGDGLSDNGEEVDDKDPPDPGDRFRTLLAGCAFWAEHPDVDSDLVNDITFLTLAEFRELGGERAGLETAESGFLGEVWRQPWSPELSDTPESTEAHEDGPGLDATGGKMAATERTTRPEGEGAGGAPHVAAAPAAEQDCACAICLRVPVTAA
jgi:hypothetical protein